MGREVRKVPAGWNPPKDKPHYDTDYGTWCREWKAGYERWKTHPELPDLEYWEWTSVPDKALCRPAWRDEERTHFMMYETTSEGTPISPAFATPEELARWLADTGASAFGPTTATYEQWLRVCLGGHAPSAIVVDGHLQSGVSGLS